MSDDAFQRIEVITGTARRRRWSTEQKLRIIEESYEPGETVSAVARRHGVAANFIEVQPLLRRLSSHEIDARMPLDDAVEAVLATHESRHS